MSSPFKSTASQPEPIDVRDIVTIEEPLEHYIADPKRVTQLLELLCAGDIVVFKRFATRGEIEKLKKYLYGVMTTSMEAYVPRVEGAPNHFRISFDDERAVVKGWFCSWSFFPWNQDLFSLYRRYACVYHLRNMLTGLLPGTFLGRNPELGCTARLAVQFYPSGKGYMAAHTDPYDRHQIVVPIMAMSQKGQDFHSGGNFVARSTGKRISTEDFVEPGDVLLFHSQCIHGVESVDPGTQYDPLSGSGRWMMLFAVNKLAGTTDLSDSVVYPS